MNNLKVASGIAIGGNIIGGAIGTLGPASSLYKSGQEDRGVISTGLHFAGAAAAYPMLGGGIALAGNAIAGASDMDVAKNVAKKAL
jgi:hypothetical protein